MRISNFLLWQLAYSELYFTQVRWPDFTRAHFAEALWAYAGRQRRFGATGEDVGRGALDSVELGAARHVQDEGFVLGELPDTESMSALAPSGKGTKAC
jgi:hypothetical protein